MCWTGKHCEETTKWIRGLARGKCQLRGIALLRLMAITGWWATETGAWVPAFAGMTGGRGGNGGKGVQVEVCKWGVSVAMPGWWVMETGVWVPAFAGMTEGSRGMTGWGGDGGLGMTGGEGGHVWVWKWGVFVAMTVLVGYGVGGLGPRFRGDDGGFAGDGVGGVTEDWV